MSVLIKGMKMPKKCAECPFFIKSNSPKYPFVDCKIIGRLGSVFNCIGIPVDCPLVELPPHGRLIDADALNDMINRSYPMTDRIDVHNGYAICQEMIKLLPTVIEAESEDV